MDPWYDYLAFPVAPLVLLGQFLALFSRRWRRVVSAVGTVAVFAMLSLVSVLPSGEGADIVKAYSCSGCLWISFFWEWRSCFRSRLDRAVTIRSKWKWDAARCETR